MRSVELFAGGGGLALGTHMAGFTTELVAEWDKWSCDTIRENRQAGHPLMQGVDVRQGDVRDIDWLDVPEGVDLVSGGPPCQPFSGGGLGRAADDPRDMFPATAEVIRALRPRAFIVENVRGLTRSAFADYYSYIKLRLGHPEIKARDGEAWGDHFARLQREHTSVKYDLRYNVVSTLVNAANYGIPQQRWRVFIVGFRNDIDAEWSFPEATHSRAALEDAITDGSYWDQHEVGAQARREALAALRITKTLLPEHRLKRWRTVRDATYDLPSPNARGTHLHLNHVRQDGARSYPGHTGSPQDWPAKALKAGVHGVPGGENMVRYPGGRVRYFTVRESARLQTFPDDYALHGPWSEAMRQLGNAVPVELARIVAESVREHLVRAETSKGGTRLHAV